jgi:hypothetical protein
LITGRPHHVPGENLMADPLVTAAAEQAKNN